MPHHHQWRSVDRKIRCVAIPRDDGIRYRNLDCEAARELLHKCAPNSFSVLVHTVLTYTHRVSWGLSLCVRVSVRTRTSQGNHCQTPRDTSQTTASSAAGSAEATDWYILNESTTKAGHPMRLQGVVKLGGGDYDGDLLAVSGWKDLIDFLSSTPAETDMPELKTFACILVCARHSSAEPQPCFCTLASCCLRKARQDVLDSVAKREATRLLSLSALLLHNRNTVYTGPSLRNG